MSDMQSPDNSDEITQSHLEQAQKLAIATNMDIVNLENSRSEIAELLVNLEIVGGCLILLAEIILIINHNWGPPVIAHLPAPRLTFELPQPTEIITLLVTLIVTL